MHVISYTNRALMLGFVNFVRNKICYAYLVVFFSCWMAKWRIRFYYYYYYRFVR
jgi:hypothetical protein